MHTSDLEKFLKKVDLSPTVWWTGLFWVAINKGEVRVPAASGMDFFVY